MTREGKKKWEEEDDQWEKENVLEKKIKFNTTERERKAERKKSCCMKLLGKADQQAEGQRMEGNCEFTKHNFQTLLLAMETS